MLQRVSIQNFKSLKDVTLDLQKVNLLIGPNNSGKTNFLKALEFIQTATSDKELIESVKFRINGKSVDDLLEMDLSFDLIQLGQEYVSDRRYTQSIFFFTPESVGIQRGRLFVTEENKRIGNHEDMEISKFQSLFFSEAGKIIIYKPNPNKIIQPSHLTLAENLDNECSNLIAFLNSIRTNYSKKVFESIERDFENCVRDLIEINTPPVNTDEGVKLSLKFFDKNNNTFWADEVSEGVIYFLALLCIVHQPTPPKILLLEEPERGIHPRRIHEVMNFIFQLAEEKDVQIILTTHNEHVLNYFSNRPESVFVFDKNEEGATEVRNLKKDIIEPSHQRSRENGLPEIDYTSELGDNWMYGILGGVPEDVL